MDGGRSVFGSESSCGKGIPLGGWGHMLHCISKSNTDSKNLLSATGVATNSLVPRFP